MCRIKGWQQEEKIGIIFVSFTSLFHLSPHLAGFYYFSHITFIFHPNFNLCEALFPLFLQTICYYHTLLYLLKQHAAQSPSSLDKWKATNVMSIVTHAVLLLTFVMWVWELKGHQSWICSLYFTSLWHWLTTNILQYYTATKKGQPGKPFRPFSHEEGK